MIIVSLGGGGVGKGTVAAELVRDRPGFWLSRSWTTRARRPGESADAYTFVDRAAFLERIESGGFLEWAEFMDELYGTPWPDVPDGRDLVLEIDVQGAAQVKSRHADAVVVLLVPPSREVQAARLRARGDDEETLRRRLALSDSEEAAGRELADAVVVNDDLGRAVAEVAAVIEGHRR